MSTTKDLGLVQAVHVGTTPPNNTLLLWKDINVGVNVMKEFDTISSTWKALGSSVVSYSTNFTLSSSTTILATTHGISEIYSMELYVLVAGVYTKDNSITLAYNATTKDVTVQAISYSGQVVRLRILGY